MDNSVDVGGSWPVTGRAAGLRAPDLVAYGKPEFGLTTAPAGPGRASTAGRPRAASGFGPSGDAVGASWTMGRAAAGDALINYKANSAVHALNASRRAPALSELATIGEQAKEN
jgi:hypothetical protein